MVENTVDATTGTVPVRATMPNTDELLWPGTLVQVRLIFREEESVVVPSAAIQVAQAGPFVFVVKNGDRQVQPVKMARVLEMNHRCMTSGLGWWRTVVVTEGQSSADVAALAVTAREANAGS